MLTVALAVLLASIPIPGRERFVVENVYGSQAHFDYKIGQPIGKDYLSANGFKLTVVDQSGHSYCRPLPPNKIQCYMLDNFVVRGVAVIYSVPPKDRGASFLYLYSVYSKMFGSASKSSPGQFMWVRWGGYEGRMLGLITLDDPGQICVYFTLIE
jgi:hypothetical protein